MYKLITFDLDGTLTQHRSKLEPANREILEKLKKQYKVLILAAGSCKRAYDQLNSFSIDIIGNYGLEQSSIENGEFKILQKKKYSVNKKKVSESIEKLRQKTGYVQYDGDSVEFHESGLITFPLLGTKARLEDKLNFDPDCSKRSQIYELVASEFPEFNCYIGGSSSFDIVLKKYDKCSALNEYCSKNKISVEEVIFFGDGYQKGGNDEPLFKSNFHCVPVTSYLSIRELLIKEGIAI